MEGIYPVLSGALAEEKRLELIANNLANLNTGGFKRDYPLFEGVNPGAAGSPGPSPMFGLLSGIVTDFSTGPLRMTGEPLDVAIEGDGFFAVQTPHGIRYTRDGHFGLNEAGQLVTGSGDPVMGAGGLVLLPSGTVSIAEDGKVSVRGTEAKAVPVEVDAIQVVQFSDPGRLTKAGQTLFEANGEEPVPSATPRLRQGMLEGSNVNPVGEMVVMIEVLRLYEAAQKAIQTADEMAGKAANEIGRVG